MRACLAAAVLGSLLGLWISPGRGYAAELEPTRDYFSEYSSAAHVD